MCCHIISLAHEPIAKRYVCACFSSNVLVAAALIMCCNMLNIAHAPIAKRYACACFSCESLWLQSCACFTTCYILLMHRSPDATPVHVSTQRLLWLQSRSYYSPCYLLLMHRSPNATPVHVSTPPQTDSPVAAILLMFCHMLSLAHAHTHSHTRTQHRTHVHTTVPRRNGA